MDELTANEPVAGAIEALLLMATEPLSSEELAQAVGIPVPEVDAELAGLQRFYDESRRGFELRRVGNGWRYYTREEHAELIGRWLLEGQQGKLSQAALETLAVVAYLQPISRGRVSAVRGVNVDGVMRTLATRELIEEVGSDPETGAHLFGTTPLFLEKMGLTSLDELPPIAPYLPDASLLEAELSELVVPAQIAESSDSAPEPAEAAEEQPVSESGADG
jgi:segregation and condensation protein B